MLTESFYPADRSRPILDTTVGQLLREATADVPDRTALISIAPERKPMTWTYAQLLSDAEHAAAWLLERFQPGEHIAVWAPNLPEWVVLQHGAALAGLVLVTINPALRGDELSYALRQSRAAGVAFAAEFRGTDMAAVIDEVLPNLPEVRVAVQFTGWLEQVRSIPTAGTRFPGVAPDSPTQIQFTSGTTGSPKAAVLRHRAMVTNAEYVHTRAGSPEGAVWVSAMPLFHTAGCGLAGLGTIAKRGTLILGEVFEPGMLLAAVEEHAAHVLIGVPTMLRACLAHPQRGSFDYSSLLVILSGGDLIPAELIAACEDTFGVGFSTVYGQTELSPIVTQTSPEDAVHDNRCTAGRPLWNVDVAILAPAGDICPVGIEGEICARGFQQMVGYLDMPEETATTIDADGWLHTGDLGSMDDRGYLTVTGRLKDLIIRGGENIYPREVERALTQHPAVSGAVVLGVPDAHWGEAVAAVIQLTDRAQAPTAGDLHTFVRQHLAPHKTPTAWYVSETLPTNAMGKLQKYRLRERIDAGELPALRP